MDLSPAQWIWFPSERTLPNTVVLFRRVLNLNTLPIQAHGWLTADSRYRLTVNGQRIQWGPAPCDPRFLEVDPLDLTAFLRPGPNVIGVEVLYYGHGEGTWVNGKPGLLFRLDVHYQDGQQEQVVSDDRWLCWLDRAHQPGYYKRWFLRALQEEFDARLHPIEWNTPQYMPDERWLPAQILDVPADKPAASGTYQDYLTDATPEVSQSELHPRTIALMREELTPATQLTSAGVVHWQRDPRDWFEMRTPQSFTIVRDLSVIKSYETDVWELSHTHDRKTALYVTFEWTQQIVGWPCFTIEASEGTIVELICQEAHDPSRTEWLDTHLYSWSRFICREGRNTFECFDFESLRWLQLHIREMSGPVSISNVAIRRRMYAWPYKPQIYCAEQPLQHLFDAAINTLYNSAQETVVDGMGRERQQYSGDGGHQLRAVRALLGEVDLPKRFLQTYCTGQTYDGYFLQSWPGYDPLVRLAQRQTGNTVWGPMLDHSVGFVFDCWQHYLETGDREAVHVPYTHIAAFVAYLRRIQKADGLLPVEHLGVPTVWIDQEAYQKQRHKQCAFNLYVAAMLQNAYAPLASTFGDIAQAQEAEQFGKELVAATVQRFWSAERELFVNNLPWLDEEGEPRLCDRSLATALLFAQCPAGLYEASLRALEECPPSMGLSFPANACWRYWALGKYRRASVILQDFRERWMAMESIILNKTLQEFWHAQPDAHEQWSHCPVVPLYILVTEIVGLKPLTPGFARYLVHPQLVNLPALALTIHTSQGPLYFEAQREGAGHRITIQTPPGGEGVLIVPLATEVALSVVPESSFPYEEGYMRYQFQAAQRCTFWLSK